MMKDSRSTVVTVIPRRRKRSRKLKVNLLTDQLSSISSDLPESSTGQLPQRFLSAACFTVQRMCAISDSFNSVAIPLDYGQHPIVQESGCSVNEIDVHPLSSKSCLDCSDLRGGTKRKEKTSPKPWIVVIIVLGIVCILAGLGIGLYFLLRPSTKIVNKSAMLRWNSTGVTVAGINGSSGRNATQFNLPYDLAWSAAKELYVADTMNIRVQKWSTGASHGQTVAGRENGSLGATARDLSMPMGLCLDADDNLYVADGINNRVQLFSSGSLIGTMVAGTGQ